MYALELKAMSIDCIVRKCRHCQKFPFSNEMIYFNLNPQQLHGVHSVSKCTATNGFYCVCIL